MFEELHNVYGTRIIGLDFPKFADAGMEWPPYSPDLNPVDFFFWSYVKDTLKKIVHQILQNYFMSRGYKRFVKKCCIIFKTISRLCRMV